MELFREELENGLVEVADISSPSCISLFHLRPTCLPWCKQPTYKGSKQAQTSLASVRVTAYTLGGYLQQFPFKTSLAAAILGLLLAGSLDEQEKETWKIFFPVWCPSPCTNSRVAPGSVGGQLQQDDWRGDDIFARCPNQEGCCWHHS